MTEEGTATVATHVPDSVRTDSGSTPLPSIESASYKQIWNATVRPLLFEECAFDVARRFYHQFSTTPFEDELVKYLREGYVVSRPHLFCMLRPVRYGDGNAWFIALIVGDLWEAITCLPFFLPKVIFYRNCDFDVLREVDTIRAIKVSKMMAKRKERNGR